MNILERTTTEEYDEGGRLTSRTTVEKYGDDGPVLPNTADAMLDAIKELPLCEVDELFHMLCVDMKTYHPVAWARETMREYEKCAKNSRFDYLGDTSKSTND